MTIDAGDRLPEFNLQTDGGGQISSSQLAGRAAVIYFYPKDNTSGCTKEAQAFRDAAAAFADAGITVYGVSPDGVVSHDKFKAKHDLNFTLISDPEHDMAEAFGVWVEKSMYGKKYMGVERSTFMVDKAGVIRQVWRKVKVAGHVENVLDAAQALS